MSKKIAGLITGAVLLGLALPHAAVAGPGEAPVSRDPRPPRTGDQDSSSPTTPGSMPALDFTGRWEGTYVCGQGVTGLTLRVIHSGSDGVAAVFDFHPVAQNPNVPSGEFTMTGEIDARRQRLTLHSGQWIDQPPNYVMVDLDGSAAVSTTGTAVLTGAVVGPGCGTFSLTRTEPPVSGGDAR